MCYLPADTKKNARAFIELTKPSAAIFIKYEFWLHYFEALKKNDIPLYLASAVFRKSQPFFKWYGGLFRRIILNVNYFYVQDNESAELLHSIGYANVDVTGDTRFDRVTEIMNKRKSLIVLERFCRGSRVIIAGSTWPEDEELILKSLSLKKHDSVKLVIASHEISKNHISEILKKCNDYFGTNSVALYSSYDEKADVKILLIDDIGFLSTVYSYGEIAWIGGGFGKGIHNVLEAAVYGLPVIFGPNYEKFREAILLLQAGGGYSVKNVSEASRIIDKLLSDKSDLQKSSSASSEFVKKNTGATDKIYNAIKSQLFLKSKLDDISA